MNRKQIVVMWAAIVVLFFMGLVPPWNQRIGSGSPVVFVNAGYRWVNSPPAVGWYDGYPLKRLVLHSPTIDLARLGVQAGIIIILAAGFMVTFRGQKRSE